MIAQLLDQRFLSPSFFMADNDENTNFLFCRKSFHLNELRCNQSYRRRLFLHEPKTRINSYVYKRRKCKK